MLRICLAIAIVAGLAAGGFAFFRVQEVMKQTMQERDTEKAAKVAEIAAHNKTKKELAETKKTLKSTQEELASTQKELKTQIAKVGELEKNNQNLTTHLDRTKAERDTAQQTLEQWRILQISPSQVRELQANYKSALATIKTFTAENKILNGKIVELNNELLQYRDPNAIVHLPPMTGHILAVDPKYDFVVVDLGSDKGLLKRGELLVNRGGRLVAKVKVADVKDHRAIANVMPGWTQAQVMEGDEVLSYQ